MSKIYFDICDRSNFGQQPPGLNFRRHFVIVCKAVKQFLTQVGCQRPVRSQVQSFVGWSRLPGLLPVKRSAAPAVCVSSTGIELVSMKRAGCAATLEKHEQYKGGDPILPGR